MNIIGYFDTYASARNLAQIKKLDKTSIQHCGSGWQLHPWVLLQIRELVE